MATLVWYARPISGANSDCLPDEAKDNGVLEQLLDDYRAYGLPMPPDDAKLARFPSGWCTVGGDGEEVIQYHLGFLLQAGENKKAPRLLLGTTEYQPVGEHFQINVVEPKEATANEFYPGNRRLTFELNCGLALAIQCKSRGWHQLSQRLLDVSLKQSCGHPNGLYYQAANQSPRVALAHLAFAHWANEVLQPHADGTMIAKKLNALFKANPELDDKGKRYLLESLELSLVSNKPEAGSVDALIDELADFNDRKTPASDRVPASSPYERLEHLSFEAVPILIGHLEDKRLTHSATPGFNNFPPWHRQVRHIVSDLLQEIAGDGIRRDWLDRQRGSTITKADALVWWEKAHETGEETYLAEHVLPADPKGLSPNGHVLKLLAEKYPRHLPRLYTTILEDRPLVDSSDIADAVTSSSVPREVAIELFVKAGKHDSLEHRRAAFWNLKNLDKERFSQMLVETLEELPQTPSEPYWRCPEASFAALVSTTDDAQIWEKLFLVAKRCDVGLRMEMLRYVCQNKANRTQLVAFLAGFLDDDTVRDVKTNTKLFGGPCAASSYRRLEVRNFAALELALILKLKHQPEPRWSEEEWKILRAQVLREAKK